MPYTLVVVSEPIPTADCRIWKLRIDRATGTAVPHGTVFGW